MELNYDVLEAISNVYIALENVSGDCDFDPITTVNDVLNVKGLYCPTDILNWHLEYLEENDILGCHNEKGYYLLHDKNTTISQTSSKIYAFIHNLKKDYGKPIKSKLNMFGINPNGEKVKTSVILEDDEHVGSHFSEYELVDSHTYDDAQEPEQYVALSKSKVNTYYNIEVVDGNIQCSCKAFYYNANVYCKHIVELKKKLVSGEVMKQSYPTISSILIHKGKQNFKMNTSGNISDNSTQLCNNVKHTINKVDAPKPPDECLHSFYTKDYEVKILKDCLTCTCPDFKYRGPLRFCKHMKFLDKYPEDEWTPYFSDFKAKCEC